MAHILREHYIEHYEQMRSEIEKSHYFHHFVIHRYIYKGISVERETRRLLKRYDDFSRWIDTDTNEQTVLVLNSGKGQFALLYALVHPGAQVYSYGFDRDEVLLAECCTSLPKNLRIFYSEDIKSAMNDIERMDNTKQPKTFLLFPDDKMRCETVSLQPVIVR